MAKADAADDDRRIYGQVRTVGEMFAVEAPLLRPLPGEVFEPGLTLNPRVDRHARVMVRNCQYSVPARFISRRVRVQLRSNELVIFDGRSVIARHERSTSKGTQVLTWTITSKCSRSRPGHCPGRPRSSRPARTGRSPLRMRRFGRALFLAYTGVRFGELAALRVRHLDLLRRRATIAEAVAEVHGKTVFSTPKNHQSRLVSIPRFLIDDLAALIAGRALDDFVFTAPKGGILRLRNFRRAGFEPAVRSAGLSGITPHSLRHTAASLAIAAGANVKVVQTMLGHKSATMTLDLYGHLFEDQLDEVADAMSSARASADFLRTQPAGVRSITG